MSSGSSPNNTKSGFKFNLIKNDQNLIEKRVLPRFPFTFMTFKMKENSDLTKPQHNKVFEVRDLSLRGMHLALKDGGHPFIKGAEVEGQILWKGKKVALAGKVVWANGQNIGIEFGPGKNIEKELIALLSIEQVAADFRPLHLNPFEANLPSNLKYWLKADGPAEVFVWQHSDGELARFQFLYLDHFVEWEDGKGVKTGRLINIRDIETPLAQEDEFMFEMDSEADQHKISLAHQMMDRIPTDYIPNVTSNFLRLKLGVTL